MTVISTFTAVTGDIILAAQHNSGVRDQLLKLGINTGNGDPTTNTVLRGTAPGVSAWGQVVNADTNFGGAPLTIGAQSLINRENTTGEGGQLHFQRGDVTGTPVAVIDYWEDGSGRYFRLWENGGSIFYTFKLSGGTPSLVALTSTFWHSTNDGSGSGLDADTLRGYLPGNSSGNIPLSNGVVNTNLNADLLDGFQAAAFALLTGATFTGQAWIDQDGTAPASGSWATAQLRISSAITGGKTPGIGFERKTVLGLYLYLDADNSLHTIDSASNNGKIWSSANDGSGSGLDADTLRGYLPGNSSGNIPLSNGVVNTNLNADNLDGHTWQDGVGVLLGSNYTLTTSMADVTGCSFTLPKAGKWEISAFTTFNFQPGGADASAILTAQVNAGGSDLSPVMIARCPTSGGGDFASSSAEMSYSAPSGGETVKLRARKDSGTHASSISANSTGIRARWVGP
jgi:hypothetical protein